MTDVSIPTTRATQLAVWVTTAWFGLVLVLAASGVLAPPADSPPMAIGLLAALPPLGVLGLLRWSPGFRIWARSLDLRFLTLLQTWRAAGLAFLALWVTGELPAGFAIPAGLGDVAVALTAPLIAMFVVGRGGRGPSAYLAWNAFGVADLLAAVGLGVLHSAGPAGLLAGEVGTDAMAQLPMLLIPAFGVPFTLSVHAISVAAVRTTRWGS